MRILILFFVIALISAQINMPCVTNDTCQNVNAPCTNTNCVCDPQTLTCKLALGSPCTTTMNNCQTGSVCSEGICLALDGQSCEEGLCLTGGTCLQGICRAMPGFAWDPVTQTYLPCDPICETCFAPNNSLACLTCVDSDKQAIGGACVCLEGAADVTGQCLPCDVTCLTCAVPQTPYGCTACIVDTLTLVSGVCFCPDGMAFNNMTLACESCDPSCATCSIPGNPLFCTSCNVGTLVNGNCTTNPGNNTQCPNGTAPDANGICLPCDISCVTCLVPGNPNRCTSCTPDKRLVGGMCVPYKVKYKKFKRPPTCCPALMASINGVCKCIRGYVGDSLSPSTSDTFCLPCDPSCLTCFEAENPQACTSCFKGMFLIDGVCSMTPFEPPSIDCSPVCTNCTVANDPLQCTGCVLGNSQLENGICFCPAGNFNLSNLCVSPCDFPCAECFINDSSICTACPPDLLALGGTCVCPNGTALSSLGDCAPCNVSCSECALPDDPFACTNCTDPSATLTNGQCICPDPIMFINETGFCQCPEGQVDVGGICQFSLCPPGTFPNNGGCEECTLPNCANCSSLTVCTDCDPGFFLLGGRCIRCPTNCLTCDSATVCTLCAPGFNLVNGKCVKACPACCLTCTYDAQGNPVCTSCLNSFVFTNGKCSACSVGIPYCANCRNCVCTRCQTGFFLQSPTQCTACNVALPGCLICNGPDVCLQCESGYVLDPATRTCFFQNPGPGDCPEGTFMNKMGQCSPCFYNCKNCIGAGMNMCTECFPNAVLYPEAGTNAGRCVCQSNFYFDRNQRRCIPSTVAKPSK